MKFLLLILTFFIITVSAVENTESSQKVRIALLSSPSVIGRYTQSSYNVSLATCLASNYPFELISFNIKDESTASLSEAMEKMNGEKIDAAIPGLSGTDIKVTFASLRE